MNNATGREERSHPVLNSQEELDWAVYVLKSIMGDKGNVCIDENSTVDEDSINDEARIVVKPSENEKGVGSTVHDNTEEKITAIESESENKTTYKKVEGQEEVVNVVEREVVESKEDKMTTLSSETELVAHNSEIENIFDNGVEKQVDRDTDEKTGIVRDTNEETSVGNTVYDDTTEKSTTEIEKENVEGKEGIEHLGEKGAMESKEDKEHFAPQIEVEHYVDSDVEKQGDKDVEEETGMIKDANEYKSVHNTAYDDDKRTAALHNVNKTINNNVQGRVDGENIVEMDDKQDKEIGLCSRKELVAHNSDIENIVESGVERQVKRDAGENEEIDTYGEKETLYLSVEDIQRMNCVIVPAISNEVEIVEEDNEETVVLISQSNCVVDIVQTAVNNEIESIDMDAKETSEMNENETVALGVGEEREIEEVCANTVSDLLKLVRRKRKASDFTDPFDPYVKLVDMKEDPICQKYLNDTKNDSDEEIYMHDESSSDADEQIEKEIEAETESDNNETDEETEKDGETDTDEETDTDCSSCSFIPDKDDITTSDDDFYEDFLRNFVPQKKKRPSVPCPIDKCTSYVQNLPRHIRTSKKHQNNIYVEKASYIRNIFPETKKTPLQHRDKCTFCGSYQTNLKRHQSKCKFVNPNEREVCLSPRPKKATLPPTQFTQEEVEMLEKSVLVKDVKRFLKKASSQTPDENKEFATENDTVNSRSYLMIRIACENPGSTGGICYMTVDEFCNMEGDKMNVIANGVRFSIYLSKDLTKHLERYVNYVRPIIDTERNNFIFITENGTSLSIVQASSSVKLFYKRATDVDKKFNMAAIAEPSTSFDYPKNTSPSSDEEVSIDIVWFKYIQEKKHNHFLLYWLLIIPLEFVEFGGQLNSNVYVFVCYIHIESLISIIFLFLEFGGDKRRGKEKKKKKQNGRR